MVSVKLKDDMAMATVGAISILAALAGRLTRVAFKPLNLLYERGRSLGTIERARYIGALRTPIKGVLTECNLRLAERPKLLNDSPYKEGWFVRLKITKPEELSSLSDLKTPQDEISRKIRELHVRCFKAYPFYELYEIGVECAAVLVRPFNPLSMGLASESEGTLHFGATATSIPA